ncbi:hypothetical protein [Hymenobacter canadensis]|uniref:Uncharacterized protein n=1 Tax=Hymenobacter canadensis TaxID=2999067 RepID=A0ABY7LKZ2_9BACT|nr:hypothetical protein [Hymenobacter canadensis]WBA41119.1 hypothetical protein O3303_14990 [Hymenobacter canadensis]
MADQSELTQILQHLTSQSGLHQQQIQQLGTALERNTSVLETVATVQNQMLDQLQLIYEEQRKVNSAQQDFNERQMRFNSRQEETDAILLSELREIRTDLRELKTVVLTDHEERLRRLEEFMRRAS